MPEFRCTSEGAAESLPVSLAPGLFVWLPPPFPPFPPLSPPEEDSSVGSVGVKVSEAPAESVDVRAAHASLNFSQNVANVEATVTSQQNVSIWPCNRAGTYVYK